MQFPRSERDIQGSLNRLSPTGNGDLELVSSLIGSKHEYLEELISKLPKPAKDLLNLSAVSSNTKKLFERVVSKSFDYLKAVADTYLTTVNDFYDSPEFHKYEIKEKDSARRYSHEALISSINPWLRSLLKDGIDTGFLLKKIEKNNRESYADFGLALALDIYVNNKTKKNFDNKNSK